VTYFKAVIRHLPGETENIQEYSQQGQLDSGSRIKSRTSGIFNHYVRFF